MRLAYLGLSWTILDYLGFYGYLLFSGGCSTLFIGDQGILQ